MGNRVTVSEDICRRLRPAYVGNADLLCGAGAAIWGTGLLLARTHVGGCDPHMWVYLVGKGLHQAYVLIMWVVLGIAESLNQESKSRGGWTSTCIMAYMRMCGKTQECNYFFQQGQARSR